MDGYQWRHVRKYQRQVDSSSSWNAHPHPLFHTSMAAGIDNADVICCFMTSSYQTSRNCQLELEYAN